MKTWIALLRGINVGGRHTVPMRDLKALMEAAGFANVRTYIQSGNVVFEGKSRPTDELPTLIEGEFGFRPEVFILSETELRTAIANNPFAATEGKAIHFFFCDRSPKSFDRALLDSVKSASEDYALAGKVFYLYAPAGIARSTLVQKLGKAFAGVTMTARNLNTVRKLASMLD